MQLLAVEINSRFAQPGAGGNDGGVPARIGLAGVQRDKIVRTKFSDSVGVGFQIVEQMNIGNFQFATQLAGIDDPRQIRRLHPAIANRPGDSESGMFDRLRRSRGPLRGDKRLHDFVEPLVLAAGILGLRTAVQVCRRQLRTAPTAWTCRRYRLRGSWGEF